jgi:hypothetical protein
MFSSLRLWLLAISIGISGSLAAMSDDTGLASLPLDGSRFRAGIVREGQPVQDVIVFKDGIFSSEMCRRYNFDDAPYWTRTRGDTVQFRAELNNPTDGRMVWEGSVADGLLQGTVHWTRKRWYRTVEATHPVTDYLEGLPQTPQE